MYYYPYGMFYDASYILVVIGAVLCMMASLRVKTAFQKYSKIRNMRGITGAQVAERILRDAGIYDVRVERVAGELTDHFSPQERVVRLSSGVYDSDSIAAVGVAAHECGHAIQHSVGYFPIQIRSAVIPMANIGSTLAWPLILLGLFIGATGLAEIGIGLFSLVVFFQLITLPVEFNASRRALTILRERQLLYQDEWKGARAVLTAAALTYVAAMVNSILQLLRLLMLTNRRRR